MLREAGEASSPGLARALCRRRRRGRVWPLGGLVRCLLREFSLALSVRSLSSYASAPLPPYHQAVDESEPPLALKVSNPAITSTRT
jgi:hypothetical protein